MHHYYMSGFRAHLVCFYNESQLPNNMRFNNTLIEFIHSKVYLYLVHSLQIHGSENILYPFCFMKKTLIEQNQ